MPLPVAAKGVIIVGGIVVAVGVALYEHEAFRVWFDDNWEKANAAWQDFSEHLTPEGRQRRREAAYGPVGSGAGASRWTSAQPPHTPRNEESVARRCDADTERARLGREYLRRRQRYTDERRDSGVGEVQEMNLMEERGVKTESNTKDSDKKRAGGPSLPTHQSPLAYHPINTESASCLQTNPFVDPPVPGQEQRDEDRSEAEEPVTPTSTIPPVFTPMTPRTPAINALDRDDVSEASLDMFSSVHTPGSETDSFDDPLSDMRSQAGTETMSHISIDPETGEEREFHSTSDRDDVMSVASSWSQVSSVGPAQ